jgi:hypothetical protein
MLSFQMQYIYENMVVQETPQNWAGASIQGIFLLYI